MNVWFPGAFSFLYRAGRRPVSRFGGDIAFALTEDMTSAIGSFPYVCVFVVCTVLNVLLIFKQNPPVFCVCVPRVSSWLSLLAIAELCV